MSLGTAIALVASAFALIVVGAKLREARRAAFIRTHLFPPGLYARLRKRRPDMTQEDCQLVGQGLRQFFLAYLRGGRRFVSMPSQVADDLWHEFILYTRHYDRFCRRAFGRFFHHTPAAVLSKQRRDNAGLRRCWWHACRAENIDPRRPARLPLLFALDARPGIADGFHYVPDCSVLRARGNTGSGLPYCGGDFSDSSIDGTTDGFGDGGDSGDGGDGAGDSSCGGGCGGD